MKKTGIIIQARLGSTRLPNKVIKSFYEGNNILEIILRRFSAELNTEIILATTTNPIDDELEKIGKNFDIKIFRGSETDVLKRFIDAAEYNNIDNIIRVCADNPFIQSTYIQHIVDVMDNTDVDYLSYKLTDSLPTIKSHIGLFAEGTTLETLKKVYDLTDDAFYHEHVTNYIYENSQTFDVKLIDVPDFLKKRVDLRFTLDTHEDYVLLQNLYAHFVKNGNNIKGLVAYIDMHSEILSNMKNTINQNIK